MDPNENLEINDINPGAYNTLDERLEVIEGAIETITGDTIDNSSLSGLSSRITALDEKVGQATDNTTNPATPASGLYDDVEALQAEVEAAHRTLDEGTDSLDNRFDDIDGRLNTLTDTIGNRSDTTVEPPIAASGLYATIETLQTSKVNSADLATVATSGSYNDLLNTPTIPTKVSDLTDDSGHYTKPAGGIPAADLAETYLTTH